MRDNENNLQIFISERIVKPIEFETVDDGAGERFLGSLRPLERKVVEVAFDHGGFIAGGCPRYVTETIDHTGGYERIDADAYRQFGDCDLFFQKDEDYKKTREALLSRRGAIQTSLDDNDNITTDERGIFATNIHTHEKVAPVPGASYIRSLPMQLIGCQFGDAITTMRRFDFLNSMIAFVPDAQGKLLTVRARRWLENERSNSLEVLVWDSPLSFYRIQKYIQKYGYETIKHTGLSHDQIMQDMSHTMERLPFDPGHKSRNNRFGIAPQGARDGKPIVFTQQNYAFHIVSTVEKIGYTLPEEMVVFMVTLAMATGVIDSIQGSTVVKRVNDLRANWDPKVIRPRVASWKESQLKMIEDKADKKRRMEAGEDVYGLGMRNVHTIPFPDEDI